MKITKRTNDKKRNKLQTGKSFIIGSIIDEFLEKNSKNLYFVVDDGGSYSNFSAEILSSKNSKSLTS